MVGGQIGALSFFETAESTVRDITTAYDWSIQSFSRTDRRSTHRHVVDPKSGLANAIVFGLEVSRLARNNADWYRLLDLCDLTDTVIADADSVYHPAMFNGRLQGHYR